jgi:hypothetical protein
MVNFKRITTRGLTALVLAILVGLAGLFAVSPVLAQESKACTVSINSSSANDATIELEKDEGVSIRVIAPEDSVHNNVYLKIFGRRVKISEMDGDGGEFQGTFSLSDVSGWGVGLHELVWESLDSQNTALCSATTRLRILGSPFGTVVGIAGVAAMTLGLSSLAFTLRTTINAGARWAIKAVTGAKVERGGAEDTGAVVRIKPSLSVTQTLTSTIAGILAGGGSLATLQQAGLSPPSLELAFELVLPFALLGLLAGVLGRGSRSAD